MDQEFTFRLQGSVPTPFLVIFGRSGNALSATCTCNAGLLGKLCKHRLGLLKGDPTGIVGGNEAEVPQILELFRGTEGERALRELLETEASLSKAQALFTAKKNNFLTLVQTTPRGPEVRAKRY